MKTNKQQLVLLMLLVIPTTLTMVTVIEQKAQASLPGQIGQGYDDGRAQARSDFAQGIRHAVCPQGSDMLYCSFWTMGYNDAWNGLNTANGP
jgi:hypothetical protein